MKNASDWTILRRALNLAQATKPFQECTCPPNPEPETALCGHCYLDEAQRALARVMTLTIFHCAPRKWQDLPAEVREVVIEFRANKAWTEAEHCVVWMLQTIEKEGDPPGPEVLAYRAQLKGFSQEAIEQALDHLAKLLR